MIQATDIKTTMQKSTKNIVDNSRLTETTQIDQLSSITDDFRQAVIINDIESKLIEDEQFRINIEQGKPRKGHPEASIKNHIIELKQNLQIVTDQLKTTGRELSPYEIAALSLIITAHDSFKPQSKKGVPIEDYKSHSSIAARYLARHTSDTTIISIVQNHDVPFSVYRGQFRKGKVDIERLINTFEQCGNSKLFLLFQIIDNITIGKIAQVDRCPVKFTLDNLIRHCTEMPPEWNIFEVYHRVREYNLKKTSPAITDQ